MTAPNILFLMTDQQRWDFLGVYGCDWTHTPHLDHLGAEGMVFDAARSTTPSARPRAPA